MVVLAIVPVKAPRVLTVALKFAILAAAPLALLWDPKKIASVEKLPIVCVVAKCTKADHANNNATNC